jgi:GNAT superfamily N-acetyltransferase
VATAVAAFVHDPALRHFFLDERYPQQASAFFGYLVDEHLPDSTYWYLGVLATHPDHTGRRLGATVMQAGIDHATGAAFLETTNPANVGYYERNGWTITASITTDVLPIWVLRNG